MRPNSIAATVSDTYNPTVVGAVRMIRYRGKEYLPDVDELYRAMVANDESFESQLALWRSFIDQYQEIGFARACMKCISETQHVMAELQTIDGTVALQPQKGCSKPKAAPPLTPYGTQRFTYLGDNLGLQEKDIRKILSNLEEKMLLPHDEENSRNLLRLIGISHNERERNEPIPWVRWGGFLNSLHCWVDCMHDAGIIGSGCGNDMRWIIAAGGFVDQRGHQIDHARLSNSNQLSPRVQRQVQQSVPMLRRVASQQ